MDVHRPTILQVKRKRDQGFEETIILERPAKCAKTSGDIIEAFQAVSLNPPPRKVFQHFASTDEVGSNFMSNEDRVREYLSGRQQKRQQSLQHQSLLSNSKRLEQHQNSAKEARQQQINKVRTLSTLKNPFNLVELTPVVYRPPGLQLPVVKRTTQIIDDNDYVTHYYVLEHSPELEQNDVEMAGVSVVPVESFDFEDEGAEYDEDRIKDEDDTSSEIDYPDSESSDNEEEEKDWYGDRHEEYNEEHGPEDSYSC